jgi:hypothetical protein
MAVIRGRVAHCCASELLGSTQPELLTARRRCSFSTTMRTIGISGITLEPLWSRGRRDGAGPAIGEEGRVRFTGLVRRVRFTGLVLLASWLQPVPVQTYFRNRWPRTQPPRIS